MEAIKCGLYLIFTLILNFVVIANGENRRIELKMPQVRPTHDESYLCVSQRLNSTSHEFIVGFQPEASAEKVHHILIYGCSSPGKFIRDTPNYVWECGEMSQVEDPNSVKTVYDRGQVCGENSKVTILFGWALNAPAIKMPPKVGFKVGGNSGIDFLVLQVHYGNTEVFRKNPELDDDSGITLETVWGDNHGVSKMAGIYLLLSYGYVPVGVSKHTMQCRMDEDRIIHPFRFRTHTHKLGVKVGAYKLSGSQKSLIGEHDPQQPQMFYPVEDQQLTIGKGDQIFAYCDYNNTREKTVYIGATGNDEMCNFYLMYWTDGEELLEKQDCLQYNPH